MSLCLSGGYAQTGSSVYKWPRPPYLPNRTQDLFTGPDNEVFDLIFWKGGAGYKNGVEYITEYKLTLELRGNGNTHQQEVIGQKQEKEDTNEDPELKVGD